MNEEQLSVLMFESTHVGIVDNSETQVYLDLVITSLKGLNELCHCKQGVW
jgi:hypothetical protein